MRGVGDMFWEEDAKLDEKQENFYYNMKILKLSIHLQRTITINFLLLNLKLTIFRANITLLFPDYKFN